VIRFVFDLDGTITSEETLPVIAKKFHIEDEIHQLIQETVFGHVPYVESFIRRVHIMSQLPVNEIADLLKEIPVHKELYNFISKHKDKCVVVTGNLGCWTQKLCDKIGCVSYTSDASVKDNHIEKLTSILKKEKIVKDYQQKGYSVVFIGEGNNDLEAMRCADVSIACGLTHNPANTVLGITDYVIYEEGALCRQLNQLL
jgi:HAD superfamily phosphoserine phosphatase-like hydrolase